MKSDLAARLAAVVVDVSVADADAIIREFLTQIVRCAVCDDTGIITIRHDISIVTPTQPDHAVANPRIEAGTVVPCPNCGGADHKGRVRHDPEFVAWQCFARDAESDCQRIKDDPTRIDEEHAACGYRIVLPLRLPSPVPER